MKALLHLLLTAFALPALAVDQPNVLFIAIDDLRNDLGALDAAHAKTPQLDAFAKTARVFSPHFVQVPTCGASRGALLRGRYPTLPAHVGNDAIKATHPQWAAQSLPSVFRQHGYRTLALGKIGHYPGGLAGKGWAEGREETHAGPRGRRPDERSHCRDRGPLPDAHRSLRADRSGGTRWTLAASAVARSRRTDHETGARILDQNRRTVRSERWRLIVHPGPADAAAAFELFDMQSDPDE